MPPPGATATEIATPTGVAVIDAVFEALTTTAPAATTVELSMLAVTSSLTCVQSRSRRLSVTAKDAPAEAAMRHGDRRRTLATMCGRVGRRDADEPPCSGASGSGDRGSSTVVADVLFDHALGAGAETDDDRDARR